MFRLLLLLGALTFSISLYAQAERVNFAANEITTLPEFGTLSEIALGNRVYVWANDLVAREIIVKELTKESQFQIADSVENADFALIFALDGEVTGRSVHTGSSGSSSYSRNNFSSAFSSWGFTTINKQFTGDMSAVARGKNDVEGNPRPRILWSTRKVREYTSGITFNRHPAVNGTREFIKEWKKAKESAPALNNGSRLQPLVTPPEPVEALSNADVIELTKIGLSEELIIAKIAKSKCAFDTTVAGLKELKAANISERIIVTMLDASATKAPVSRQTVSKIPVPQQQPRSQARQPEFVSIDDIASGKYKIGRKQ